MYYTTRWRTATAATSRRPPVFKLGYYISIMLTVDIILYYVILYYITGGRRGAGRLPDAAPGPFICYCYRLFKYSF